MRRVTNRVYGTFNGSHEETYTEARFQTEVAAAARLLRWQVYHTHDSRRSEAGFPDLVLTNGSRVLFAELKTQRGIVSEEQQTWLSRLGSVALFEGSRVEVHLWRPSDWDDLLDVLKGKTR